MKMMNKIVLLSGALLITGSLKAQIEISEQSQSSEVKELQILPAVEKSTDVFVSANWSSTNRNLVENDGLFGEPLGLRADEVKLNVWSFGLGIRNRVHRYFTWEGGMSFIRNGESYSFEGSDSTFSYNTTYSYISMPFKGYFTYGKNIRVFAGGGVIPQMFLQYKQEQEWENSVNAKGDETIKTKSGYNSFVISLAANIGVQVSMGKNVSLFVMPEYRYQLTSTYEKTDEYKHFGRAFGLNMGLTYSM
jgi:hypothetical protein